MKLFVGVVLVLACVGVSAQRGRPNTIVNPTGPVMPRIACAALSPLDAHYCPDGTGSSGDPHTYTTNKVYFDWQGAGYCTFYRSDDGLILINGEQSACNARPGRIPKCHARWAIKYCSRLDATRCAKIQMGYRPGQRQYLNSNPPIVGTTQFEFPVALQSLTHKSTNDPSPSPRYGLADNSVSTETDFAWRLYNSFSGTQPNGLPLFRPISTWATAGLDADGSLYYEITRQQHTDAKGAGYHLVSLFEAGGQHSYEGFYDHGRQRSFEFRAKATASTTRADGYLTFVHEPYRAFLRSSKDNPGTGMFGNFRNGAFSNPAEAFVDPLGNNFYPQATINRRHNNAITYEGLSRWCVAGAPYNAQPYESFIHINTTAYNPFPATTLATRQPWQPLTIGMMEEATHRGIQVMNDPPSAELMEGQIIFPSEEAFNVADELCEGVDSCLFDLAGLDSADVAADPTGISTVASLVSQSNFGVEEDIMATGAGDAPAATDGNDDSLNGLAIGLGVTAGVALVVAGVIYYRLRGARKELSQALVLAQANAGGAAGAPPSDVPVVSDNL